MKAIPKVSPLPVKDGVAASFVAKTQGSWPTMLAFLMHRFPFLGEAILLKRLAAGEMVNDDGRAVVADEPYRAGGYLWYYRRGVNEPVVPFSVAILHQDDDLLVVDKPPFLTVSPVGRYVQETVLTRLRRMIDAPYLAPLHRLDRETQGVMLFGLNPKTSPAYQALFAERRITKTYEAIAHVPDTIDAAKLFPLMRHTHLAADPHCFFRMIEHDAPPNAQTQMACLAAEGGFGRFRLSPHTGKKHQLRVHMAAVGCPIVHDPWYPHLVSDTPSEVDDFERPLQLLAASLAFIDPLTGQHRQFNSQRRLIGPHAV